MSELLKTEFSRLSAPGSTPPVRARGGSHTMAASIVGTAAVSFVGVWEGSNDLLAWSGIAALSASGTAAATASESSSADYQYWRLTLSSVSGGMVSTTVSTDPDSAFSESAASVSVDLMLPSKPCIGTRIVAGSMTVLTPGANAAFFDSTNQITIRLARKAYAVRLIFGGFAATQGINLKAAVSAATDVSGAEANNSAGSWVGVTFSGAATGTIPARASATRPTLYFSDWATVDVSSKILVARALIPSSGNTEASFSTFGNQSSPAGTSAAAAAWATTTGDEWVNRRQSVDGIATPASFTSTTTASGFSLIYGVQYLTTEGVITVAGVGDSIMAGTYTTLAYDVHYAKAIRALKLAGYGIECVNLGVSGQTTGEYYLRAMDAIQYLNAKYLIYSPWSPNDGGDNPTQAHVATMRAYFGRVLLHGDQYRVNILPITGIPKTVSSNSASAWDNAEDDLRRALNAEIRRYPTYLDPDIFVGNRNAAGLAAATFIDNSFPASGSEVHLSEAGNMACMETIRQKLAKLLADVAP